MKFPWKKKSTLDRLREAQAQHTDANVRPPGAQVATTEPIMPVVSPGPEPSPYMDALLQEERVPQPQRTEREAVPSVADDAIQEERERALREPLFLANTILGFSLVPEHEVLLDALLDPNALDILALWPRGAGKSTCITVAAIISILRDPNVRIFYTTSDEDLGVRRLQQTKGFFENPTPKFQKLFPEFCKVYGRGNEFTVSCRTDRSLTDPTFAANPLGADATGSHWNLILIDDLVTMKNSKTSEQRKKTYERYQGFRGLRAANTRVIVSGTKYHEDDAHVRILREAEGDSTWRLDVQDVYQPLCKNCGHKSVFHLANRCLLCAKAGSSCSHFEAGEKVVLIEKHKTRSGSFGWTLEDLEREQGGSRMGRQLFASQFEMNTSPEVGFEHVKFTPQFLREHTWNEMLSYRPQFIVADLGLRTSDRANPTVLMAIVIFNCTAYPLACVWGKWGAKEAEDAIFDFMERHNCWSLFVEDIGAFEFLRNNISKRAPEIRNLQIIPIPVDKRENAKLHRIENLHGAMVESKIGLYSHMRGYEILAHQLEQSPHIKPEDDFADCLSLALVVAETMPSKNMPPIVGRAPVIQPAPSTVQILSPAEEPIKDGIVWIDELSKEQRQFFQLTAEKYDSVFLTNNRALASRGWHCQQPVIGVDRRWFGKYAGHPALAGAKKIWVVLWAGNNGVNREFLESLAASPLRDKCFVIARPEIPSMFKARLQLQQQFRLTADLTFGKLYPSESIADALVRLDQEIAQAKQEKQPTPTMPIATAPMFIPVDSFPRRSPRNSDEEPYAVGDPQGWARWKREHPEGSDDDGYGGFSF